MTKIHEHLAKTFHLQPGHSPWPRMILSALSVLLPLLVGYFREEEKISILGALFGFIMILNDHFGPLGQRIIHLITAYLFIMTGVFMGVLLMDSPWLLLSALFAMAYLLGKSKGLGLELERMLLFTTLQLLAASQTPELKDYFLKAVFYTSFSFFNYLLCLCLVYLMMKHSPNFQKSKRQVFKEGWSKKETNWYALVLAFMACLGLVVAEILKLEKGFWVVGTILIVMMPDKKQSLYKSFQRLLGTLVGVLIASLLMKWGHDTIFLIVFSTLAAFFAPLGLMKNYALANIFIAGLILFFLEMSESVPHVGDFDLAITRFIDIALGCLIGIIGTLIAFPNRKPS